MTDTQQKNDSLELLSNPDDLRTYQYIVEVVNPEPSLNLVK